MFKRRINENGEVSEYYVISGGGLEENVIREMKEEFQVDVKIEEYLAMEERETNINHFFMCSIFNGIPHLGEEELERCCESNYYEVRKVKVENLDKLDIMSLDKIMKAYSLFKKGK